MPDPQPLLAQFDAFVLDEANARVARDGVPVELPPRAFAVLCALAREGGRLIVKDRLIDAVWGHQFVSDSVLKTTISQLRAALADDPKAPRYIETAQRRGYRFIAALHPVAAALAPPPVLLPEAEHEALVGRADPLRRLRERLALARQGRCQVVLVAGEPGIGKSTVLSHFLRGHAQVAQALGQCVEQYGAGEPYLPLLEALNALCKPRTGAALRTLMRQVAPTWLVQLPWYLTDADRAQLQREVGGATQQRMLRELGELLDRHTEEAPLVIALEDLHWSDEATVQAIGYLARRRGSARLMLVGTFRPADAIASGHPVHGLRQELKLHGLCEEIDLEAFSETEVEAYLRQRLREAAVPEALARRLHGHTEGLPLFVANVVDTLLAEGSLELAEDERLEVPSNIAGLVERQVARLPAAWQRWLGAASVAGAEFTDLALAEALDVDPDDLRDAFEALVRQQRWLRSGAWLPLADGRVAARFAFSHALYRNVLYRALGEAQRVQWHRRFGAALERTLGAMAGTAAGELAMHFERGHDVPRAIAYLQRAAGAALGRFAPAEAVQSARHGLALLAAVPAGEERLAHELELRVLEGVALAQLTVFSNPDVAAAFDRAQELCDRLPASPARARALHGLWWVKFGRGDLRVARGLAERIVALGESADDATLRVAGGGSLGMTLVHAGELPAAREHLECALRAYAQAGSALAVELFMQDPGVEALGYLGLLAWWMGRTRQARAFLEKAQVAAERSRHPPTQALALHMAGAVHCSLRDYVHAKACIERIYALAEKHWLAGGPDAHGWVYGRAMVGLGEGERGLEVMRAAARRYRETGLVIGLTGYHLFYADACRTLGHGQEALESAEQGLALAHQGGEMAMLSPLLRVRGELRAAAGDAAAGRDDIEEAIAAAVQRKCLHHELEARLSWARLPRSDAVEARRSLKATLARYDEPEGSTVEAAQAWLRQDPAADEGRSP